MTKLILSFTPSPKTHGKVIQRISVNRTTNAEGASAFSRRNHLPPATSRDLGARKGAFPLSKLVCRAAPRRSRQLPPKPNGGNCAVRSSALRAARCAKWAPRMTHSAAVGQVLGKGAPNVRRSAATGAATGVVTTAGGGAYTRARARAGGGAVAPQRVLAGVRAGRATVDAKLDASLGRPWLPYAMSTSMPPCSPPQMITWPRRPPSSTGSFSFLEKMAVRAARQREGARHAGEHAGARAGGRAEERSARQEARELRAAPGSGRAGHGGGRGRG